MWEFTGQCQLSSVITLKGHNIFRVGLGVMVDNEYRWTDNIVHGRIKQLKLVPRFGVWGELTVTALAPIPYNHSAQKHVLRAVGIGSGISATARIGCIPVYLVDK